MDTTHAHVPGALEHLGIVRHGHLGGSHRYYVDCDDASTWASYQLNKIAGCACAGNTWNVFPATEFKGNR